LLEDQEGTGEGIGEGRGIRDGTVDGSSSDSGRVVEVAVAAAV
jgi:hypothetical protein